jgi:hypothetical protein
MATREEVFISATSADLGSYRQVAKDAILTLGAHPIEETNFPTDYRQLQDLLALRLDPCDASFIWSASTTGESRMHR